MLTYYQSLLSNTTLKLLIIFIVMDTIFGCLRAIREKGINSTIGIDGIIRKVGMIICMLFLVAIDLLIPVDLIGFIPEDLKNFLHLGNINISDLFTFLFIIFEILSILKNMILCKLPIPKKLQLFLENIMKEFTGEIKNEDNKQSIN